MSTRRQSTMPTCRRSSTTLRARRAQNSGLIKEAAKVRKSSARIRHHDGSGSKLMPKVLLIEDDSAIADAVTEQLTDRGFAVEWSSDGIEGLDKARSHRPDVVIIDRMLPGM